MFLTPQEGFFFPISFELPLTRLIKTLESMRLCQPSNQPGKDTQASQLERPLHSKDKQRWTSNQRQAWSLKLDPSWGFLKNLPDKSTSTAGIRPQVGALHLYAVFTGGVHFIHDEYFHLHPNNMISPTSVEPDMFSYQKIIKNSKSGLKFHRWLFQIFTSHLQ